MSRFSLKLPISLMAAFCLFYFTAHSQSDTSSKRIEFSASGAIIFYQSGYAVENGAGIEVAAKGIITGIIYWQAGSRIWFNPTAPELFARIKLSDQFKSWIPSAGIEIGLTGRGKFGDGAQLLRETRNAMLEDINPIYFASHIAPLSFSFNNSWKVSIAELSFGSHVENLGRTLRLHVNVISVSKTF